MASRLRRAARFAHGKPCHVECPERAAQRRVEGQYPSRRPPLKISLKPESGAGLHSFAETSTLHADWPSEHPVIDFLARLGGFPPVTGRTYNGATVLCRTQVPRSHPPLSCSPETHRGDHDDVRGIERPLARCTWPLDRPGPLEGVGGRVRREDAAIGLR